MNFAPFSFWDIPAYPSHSKLYQSGPISIIVGERIIAYQAINVSSAAPSFTIASKLGQCTGRWAASETLHTSLSRVRDRSRFPVIERASETIEVRTGLNQSVTGLQSVGRGTVEMDIQTRWNAVLVRSRLLC